MEAFINLGVFLILLTLGYLAGRYAEKKHYKSIEEREEAFLRLPAVSMKNCADTSKEISSSELVTGSVVISIDYFKRVYAGLVNIFGGEIGAYESLLDRARREAILRMKEVSPKANIICNLRLETSSIGSVHSQKGSIGSVEVIAYGTAITYKGLQ